MMMRGHLLSHLRKLVVRECDCFEEIFFESINDGDYYDSNNSRRRDNNSTTKMQYELFYLELQSLPKLKHIWRNHHDMTILNFENLQIVGISECHELKYVFPDVSVVKSLPSLSRLEVQECNKMEMIILFRNNNTNSNSIQQQPAKEEDEPKIRFQLLDSIRLVKLPNLICFYPSSCNLELPSYCSIIIDACPKMKTFSYGEGMVYTPRLWTLSVENSKFDKDEDVNEVIRRCKRKVIN
jgi:hypothetical protein